jgi:hypothetical protein
MRKRVAEKVLSRAILTLAVYPKRTMASALRRRPQFWTEPVGAAPRTPESGRRRRLTFADAKNDARFSIAFDPGALEERREESDAS